MKVYVLRCGEDVLGVFDRPKTAREWLGGPKSRWSKRDSEDSRYTTINGKLFCMQEFKLHKRKLDSA